MRKIFKLKKWFTLKQAASYLSEAFEDEITEADIFQLADDKQLTLSVNFINSATAAIGKAVPVESAEIRILPSLNDFKTGRMDIVMQDDLPPDIINILRKACAYQEVTELESDLLGLFLSEAFTEDCLPVTPSFCGTLMPDKSNVIEIDNDRTQSIEGIWDIPMLGGDQLIIKQNLLEHINGAELEWVSMSDTFLVTEDKQKWAALRDSAEKFPTSELPADSAIVIRTTELQRFIDSFTDEPSPSPRSEDNNIKTIAVLTKALADRLGSGYGSPDKPNLSRIYEEILSKHIPEGAHGLAKSTVTERIKQGLKLID